MIQSSTDPIETEEATRPNAFAVLGRLDFRWLLLGNTLSNGASWIQQVTISYLIYELTTSGTMLGGLSLVRAVATLGLAPIAGIAIDRMAPRTLMFGTNSWLVIINLLFGLVLLAGQGGVWALFLFTLLSSAVQAFEMPLRQTVIFNLVPRTLTPNAIALIQTGWALMRTIGPALGGFLIIWFGASGNFLVQTGIYALITLTITRLNFPASQADQKSPATGSSLREGMRFVATQPSTRLFVLMGWLLPLLIIPNFAVLPPIYAKQIFHGGADTLGLLLSAIGVGGVVGGLVANWLGHFDRQGWLQLGSLFLLGFVFIAFAFSSVLWVALLWMAFAGFFEMLFITTNQTLLQLSIPDALRGRVNGIISLNAVLGTVGALVAGGGADLFGAQLMSVVLGIGSVLVAVGVFGGSAFLRNYRLSQALAGKG